MAAGSNPPVRLRPCRWPLSALCSRWLTTRRMGEDAPYLSFAIPVRAQLGGQRAFQICVALKPSAENRPSHIGGENRGERRVVSGLDRAAYVFFVDG
jgi:hypothetical protein